MKRHHTWVLGLIALSMTAPILAEDRFEVSPRLGFGTLSLDAQALKSNQSLEKDAPIAGVDLHYVNRFGPLVEVGYSTQRTRDWRDNQDAIRLSQYDLAVGWQFRTGFGFRITPKVGRARWDLYSPDALLTQTDPGTNTRRGYDNYWELSIEKEIWNNIALGASLRDNTYEFGNVKSFAFIASFRM